MYYIFIPNVISLRDALLDLYKGYYTQLIGDEVELSVLNANTIFANREQTRQLNIIIDRIKLSIKNKQLVIAEVKRRLEKIT